MVKNACELHFRKETCNSTEHLNGLELYRASDNSRKKTTFRGILRGKFAEKSADFAGFSREKSQNSRKNRPISRDFSGKNQI